MPKVWFVTGSSRGLGRSIVEYALAKGDSVIATARDKSTLSPLLEKYGPSQVLIYNLDVTSSESAQAAVQAGHQKFGRIDIVINNAGYADPASVEDSTMDDFHRQINTNFYGVVNVSKAVLPLLRQQGSGHIFQVSSIGGRLGSPGLAAYQSAKWAVGGFSVVLAQEVAPFGIKVTALEPGGIRTDWAGSSMTIPPISEPYQQTVGAMAKFIREYTGQEPSLPEKFGPIIEQVYESPEPPVRMLIGPDAVHLAGGVAAAQAKSDEEWKHLSMQSA